ncbi:SH3 domain-containing protein [Tianweitania sediminis]|jgi:hypothetical protein|nr:hypothetical protein [Tianweitania sediminis]
MFGHPAAAQTEADFVAAFAGDWQTLDPAYSDGGACRISLEPSKTADRYALTADHCGGTFSTLQGWGIVDNQLGLIGADNAILARLGGNQTRMSGDVTGGGNVVFERLPANAQTAANGPALAADCLYYGYTASCSLPADRERPTPAGAEQAAKASVLVRLNARSEARPDAPIVATIPANTCVVIEECTTASDGNWCRAKVSTYTAWIRQQAVRSNRWPVLTYAPGC